MRTVGIALVGVLSLAVALATAGCQLGRCSSSTAMCSDCGSPPALIEICPACPSSCLCSEQVLVATVKDCEGHPLPGRRVEWMVAPGSVGVLVDADDRGKKDNNFAVTDTTVNSDRIRRCTGNPAQDLVVGRGQTWAAFSSPVAGTTHVIVYSPDIADWNKQRVCVAVNWVDMTAQFPQDCTVTCGTLQPLATKVVTMSDGAPLAGQAVTYTIIDGPAATFDNGAQSITVRSDAAGMAAATLRQNGGPFDGANIVKITVGADRPALATACGTRCVKVAWLRPQCNVACEALTGACPIDGQMAFRITVTNPSNVTLDSVTVSGSVPAGAAVVGSDPQGQFDGGQMVWCVGPLPPAASKIINVTLRGSRLGQFEMRAVAVAQPCDLRCESVTCAQLGAPQLTVTNAVCAEISTCDPLCYAIRVQNCGNCPATNVCLIDNLADGVTTVDGRSQATWNLGVIAAGEFKDVALPAKAHRPGTFSNRAVATADGGLVAQATNQVIVREPKLSVTIAGPDCNMVGKPAEYRITVANDGDMEARDTILTNVLPEGYSLISATGGGKTGNGSIAWNLGCIPAGGAKSVDMVLCTLAPGQGKHCASAQAFCGQAAGELAVNARGVPGLHVSVSDTCDPMHVGADNMYRITVVNQGTADACNVAVSAKLPELLNYVSSTGQTNGAADGDTVRFEKFSLPPKGSASFDVRVRASEAGDARFEVQMTSDDLKTPVQVVESTHIY